MRPSRFALLFLAACCSAALLIRSAKLGWTLKFSSEEYHQNVPREATFGRDDPQEQQQRQQEERRDHHHAQLDRTHLRAPPVPVNPDGKETNATMAAVFVFGMHHTGTSLLTMLLEQLGLDTGGRNGLLMNPNNPAKFFELGQAVALDEGFVHAGYGYGYAWEKVRPSTRAGFLRATGNVVQWLDRHAGALRSWVMKDPRASLVAEQWLSRVNGRRRICVLTARDPIVSASRFSKEWMPGMPLQRSIDLWEEHCVRAIEGCRRTGAKIIISNHEQLVKHPFEAAQRLLAKLREAGVQSLSLPSPESFEVNYTSLWKKPSSRVNVNDAEPARRAYFSRSISPRAKRVWEALESENLELLSDEELRPQSWKTPVTWNSK